MNTFIWEEPAAFIFKVEVSSLEIMISIYQKKWRSVMEGDNAKQSCSCYNEICGVLCILQEMCIEFGGGTF